MRKAVFFVMTVKYVLILQSKVCSIVSLGYFCTVGVLWIHKLQVILVQNMWRTSEDRRIRTGRCPVTTCDLVSIISLQSTPIDLFNRALRCWNHLWMKCKTKALNSDTHCKSVIAPCFESCNSPQWGEFSPVGELLMGWLDCPSDGWRGITEWLGLEGTLNTI